VGCLAQRASRRRPNQGSLSRRRPWTCVVNERHDMGQLRGRATRRLDRRVDGIGFVFSADDPYCGVDLDACCNGTGLVPDAAAIVLRLDSYTEWSPSATGVHVILRGRLPGSRRRRGKVELNDQGRFFCMTGEHVRGTPEAVEERQAELEQITVRSSRRRSRSPPQRSSRST
jgi:primase-polymerase (primpol)-like protein